MLIALLNKETRANYKNGRRE